MLKIIRIVTIFTIALGLLAAFYFIPSDRVISEPGDSPLYAASLNNTTNHLIGKDDPGRSGDSKGGGMGNLQTCEVTCGPTCDQTTCGLTCVATCEFTCTNTCNQSTCNATCVATCEATCANTCIQPTCESTCVVTCSYTCIEPISLVSFTAEAGVDQVVVRWTTGSEVDNYYFTVWRSTNPNSGFVEIETIEPVGGVGTAHYSYVDEEVIAGTTYYYQLSDVSVYGYETVHPMVVAATPVAGLAVAEDFQLIQNYPNPFNPVTNIRFNLPSAGQAELAIFDVKGRQVRTLVNGWMDAGSHHLSWNATDDAGNLLPSGVYIYRLTTGELTASGKMIFMK